MFVEWINDCAKLLNLSVVCLPNSHSPLLIGQLGKKTYANHLLNCNVFSTEQIAFVSLYVLRLLQYNFFYQDNTSHSFLKRCKVLIK